MWFVYLLGIFPLGENYRTTNISSLCFIFLHFLLRSLSDLFQPERSFKKQHYGKKIEHSFFWVKKPRTDRRMEHQCEIPQEFMYNYSLQSFHQNDGITRCQLPLPFMFRKIFTVQVGHLSTAPKFWAHPKGIRRILK